MILSAQTYFLEFKHPFGVSSNTRIGTPTVFVKLDHDGLSGYGEACLPAYLGETTERTLAFLEAAKTALKNFKGEFSVSVLIQVMDDLLPRHNAAKAAIDTALHDLFGKRENKPVYNSLGIGKSAPKDTSLTIGIDNEKVIARKIKEAAGFSILKVKAGTEDDKNLITTIRKYSDAPLYIDVNQGWKDKQKALDLAQWMSEKNVLLIEQPMPVAMKSETAWLTERSPVPVIADESVKRLDDLKASEGIFSGINIKLMKCTGLQEALKMIRFAREKNMKVMLGCMAESSCATSAMAQLMDLADFIDLDAPNLIKNDPFSGIEYREGKVHLNDLPGIGVKPLTDLFSGK